jgi:hypothetical protein
MRAVVTKWVFEQVSWEIRDFLRSCTIIGLVGVYCGTYSFHDGNDSVLPWFTLVLLEIPHVL